MSATKRISTGDYYIDTFKYRGNPTGNVQVITGNLVVDGNLVVLGNTANTQLFNTSGNIFHINYNNTGPGLGINGFENYRGGAANVSVGLYYKEGTGTAYDDQWTANNVAGNVGYLLTSYLVKIDKSTTNPIGQTNYVVVTGEDAGSGGSGLYTNAGSTSGELTTTVGVRRYAIIFG